jgi:antitoxin PrlF
MATSRMTAKSQVTIPKALRERLGLLPGDEVKFVEADGGLRCRHE